MTAVRQTRSYLMRLFAKHGFNPRHDLGQNFLIDLNIIEFIVANALLTKDDVVLEVGCGTGGMSTFMAIQAAEVVSVDLDPNMIQLAKDTTAPFSNVTLLHQDALRNKNNMADNILELLREKKAAALGRHLKLVANLPYNVATPIVSNLMGSDLGFSRMVITIQWELGFKMQAQPGDGTYSALSVWLQSLGNVTLLKKLPPSVFWPMPKVNSAVVLIEPDDAKRALIDDLPFFNNFVRLLFTQRRKFMRSVLISMYRKELSKAQIDDVLKQLGIATELRAESMTPGQLVILGNAIGRLIKDGQYVASREELESMSSTGDDAVATATIDDTDTDTGTDTDKVTQMASEPDDDAFDSNDTHSPSNDAGETQ